MKMWVGEIRPLKSGVAPLEWISGGIIEVRPLLRRRG